MELPWCVALLLSLCFTTTVSWRQMSSWEVLLLFVCYCSTSHGHIHQALKSSVFPHEWFLLCFETHRMMCARNFRFGAVWSEYTIRLCTICLPPRAAQKASLHLRRSTSHFATWTLKSWLSTTVYLFMLLPLTPEGVTCLICALVFVVGLAYITVASWGSAFGVENIFTSRFLIMILLLF